MRSAKEPERPMRPRVARPTRVWMVTPEPSGFVSDVRRGAEDVGEFVAVAWAGGANETSGITRKPAMSSSSATDRAGFCGLLRAVAMDAGLVGDGRLVGRRRGRGVGSRGQAAGLAAAA